MVVAIVSLPCYSMFTTRVNLKGVVNMYEFSGFNQRIQSLRKAKGMTQEELADRVGVSGQAVSKWENGQSYPDITIIPDLAAILETDVDFLFGRKKSPPAFNGTPAFPEVFNGLPLVHSSDTVACYSDKEVVSRDSSGVKFADRSTAELTNRIIVNNGAGEIRFLGKDDMGDNMQIFDSTKMEKNYEFDGTDSVDISVISNECTLVRSRDDKTRVRATGIAAFMKRLRVECDAATIRVAFEKVEGNSNNSNNKSKENQIIVEVPFDEGKHAAISINGSGSFDSEIGKFNEAKLSINGSGSICAKDFDTCDANINGSGSITSGKTNELKFTLNGSGSTEWGYVKTAKATINGSGSADFRSVEDLNLSINGSGDVTADKISGGGDVILKISGSASIDIKDGACEKFDANVSGSCDIDATGLTARKAHIVLHQMGSVTLGRVIEGSTEQVKKKGTINILKRGAEN